MKKVLHIRSSGEFLGAENVVLQLSQFSSEFGYQPFIVVIHDHRDEYPLLAEYAKEKGIECSVITTQKRIDLKCVNALKELIKTQNIDLIHTHGYKEDLYAFLTFSGVPVLATNHLWKRTNTTLKLYAFIDSLVMTRFHKIVAVSKAILDEMKSIPLLRGSDMSLISNGIDHEAFNNVKPSNIRESLGLAPETPLLLTVSSLTPEKGHRFLLDALADQDITQRDWHLAIVGGGREKTSLEEQVNKLGLNDRVTFLGYRKDIPNLLKSADLYILPSLDEGLPMALLEAMAAGKPSIATNVGDVSKVIRDNSVGKLIGPGDSQALSHALRDALDDSNWRTSSGINARELIIREFSSRAMTQNYSRCYNDILNVSSSNL